MAKKTAPPENKNDDVGENDSDSGKPDEQTPAEPPRLTMAEVRDNVIHDKAEIAKGLLLYDHGSVANLGRYRNKLFGQVASSGGSPYQVAVTFGKQVKASCLCFSARKNPFCKHAAALIVAWSQAPDSFTVSDTGPAEPASNKAKRVKAGKTDKAAVMSQGVGQVSTLVRELAVAGVAGVDEGRVAQIRALGDSLRENKLRRLSARTVELAALLGHAAEHSAKFAPGDYADHLCDMLLTARKLEKHLGPAAEPIDDRHVEELIGKTWTDKERRPVADLHLIEYSFATAITADNFLIRESRFFDVMSGLHYSEKQIIPSFLKRIEPKRSYLGQVLLGASGGIYPSFAPLRLKLNDIGTPAPLSQEALSALCARALPGVSAALAAFQEQRKDLFAPTHLPVAMRVAALLAEGNTLRALDEEGHALALATSGDAGLEARLATLLRGGALRVLLGRLDINDAVPTLYPLSAVIDRTAGHGALELQPLTAPTKEVEGRSRRTAVLGAARAKGADWGEIAQKLGASPAAVVLEEVRQELAQGLSQGLVALSERAMEPLAVRLSDLGLAKQAQLLRDVVARPDPAGRVDDFVKLYQVLEIALVRLCGAAKVDRQALELLPVPTYDSVLVRAPTERLEPREVMVRRTRGEIGRYEAALQSARFYENLNSDDLLQRVFPTWADGGAIPFVVRALGQRGADAVAAAERALRGKSYMAKATAVELLRVVASEHALALLTQVAKGDFGRPRSYGAGVAKMAHAYWYWEAGGTIPPLQVRAQDCLDAIALGVIPSALSPGSALSSRQRPAAGGAPTPATIATIQERRSKQGRQLHELLLALNAPQAGERKEAVRQLAKFGDLIGAAPALRLAAGSDAAQEVRSEAVLALGLLGDWEMVEHFTALLSQRHDPQVDADQIKAATYALGYLGDVRGIAELLNLFEEGWQPAVVAEALRAVGEVALDPLLDLLLRRPELLSRKAVQDVLRILPAAELAGHLAEHVMSCAHQPNLADELRRCLKLAEPNKEAPGKLGEVLKERLAQLPEPGRSALHELLESMKKKHDKKAGTKARRGTPLM